MKRTSKYLVPVVCLAIGLVTIVTIIILVVSAHNSSNQPIASDSTEQTSSTENDFDYSWVDGSRYIAHAFGGILGKTYTNSYEAFLLNYQLGQRIFEVDFALTDDGIPVLEHDAPHWHETTNSPADTPFTYDNFRSKLIYGEFHGVDCKQLVQIMSEHPDIFLVTDTKYDDQENTKRVLNPIVEHAKQIDPSVLDRFIIQIYNEEMFDWVMEIYPWKSIIYTLYNSPGWTSENVVEFSKRTGVKYITVPAVWLNQEITDTWKNAGLYVAVHTVNDFSEVKRFQSMGVDMIYTDFLIP